MTRHLQNRLFVSFALLAMTTLPGCDYVRGFVKDVNAPVITREGRNALPIAPPRIYPAEAEIGPPLDIEVIRVDNAIMLDNRTVHAYENVELWLNQEYGGGLEAVAIGRGELYSLKSFYNEHNERYPTAKFLQPDADQVLILCELVIDGKVHKITTRLAKNWRLPR